MKKMFTSFLLLVLFLCLASPLSKAGADKQYPKQTIDTLEEIKDILYRDDWLNPNQVQLFSNAKSQPSPELPIIELKEDGQVDTLDLLDFVDYSPEGISLYSAKHSLNQEEMISLISQKLYQASLIPADYTEIELKDYDENHWSLEFKKNTTISNPYQYCWALIEKTSQKLVYFTHNNQIDETDLPDSYQDSILLSDSQIQALKEKFSKEGPIEKIYPGIGRFDHEYINKNKDKAGLLLADDFFLAWFVDFSNGSRYYLDPLSQEVIYRDLTENSTSFYDRETGRYRWERAKNIAIAMKNKGLPGGQVAVNSNTSRNKSSILYNINTNQNQRGFSFSGHSTNSGEAMFLTPNGSGETATIHHSECKSSSRWRFVFMDMCSSESNNVWASTFNIWSSSKGKVLLGWRKGVLPSTSHYFCDYLARYTTNYPNSTLYQNVQRAKASAKSAGHDPYHLNFRGDYNY